MRTIGAYEAKTHLSQLLDEVERGGRVKITRKGQPVAILGPVPAAARSDPRQVVEELRRLRRKATTGGLSVRAMIEEGRRF